MTYYLQNKYLTQIKTISLLSNENYRSSFLGRVLIEFITHVKRRIYRSSDLHTTDQHRETFVSVAPRSRKGDKTRRWESYTRKNSQSGVTEDHRPGP